MLAIGADGQLQFFSDCPVNEELALKDRRVPADPTVAICN